MSALDDLPPPSSSLDDLPPPEKYDPSHGSIPLQIGPWKTGINQPEWLSQATAGAGKAGYDIARGAGQWLGLESREDVEKSRKLDEPLMNTTAGKIGNVVGNIGFAAPAMLIPGAQAPIGAAAVGAGLGALQPSVSSKETVSNISLGGAAGALGSWAGKKIADWAGSSNAAREAAAQADASINSERDAVLSKAKEVGYVVPPTAVNANATNTALESISGKAATRQSATATNQKVTNNLVRDDLGLPENVPITPQSLANVRSQEGKIYESVKGAGTVKSDTQYANDLQSALTGSPQLQSAYPGIGGQADQKLKDLVESVLSPEHDASNIVEAVKFIRNQAKGNFKSSFVSGNPDQLSLARGQQGVADAMEDLLKRHLQANGQSDLADAWDAARTTIAKTHSVEAALQGNNVSAANLAMQLRKGKPMSGGMDIAAQFGNHFGEVAGLPKSGAGVSKLAATIAGTGELGAYYLQSPKLALGTLAAAISPYAVRSGMLSKYGQSVLATPNYSAGSIGTFARNGLQTIGNNGARLGAVPLSQLMGND